MSRVSLLSLTLILLFLFPVQAQECDVEEDEFEGVISIKCDVGEVQVEEQPDDSLSYAGLQIRGFPEREMWMGATLTLRSNTVPLNFNAGKKAFALIDGDRYEFKARRAVGEARGGPGEKIFGITLRPEAVRAIEASEEFRVKLGEAVFNFSSAIDDVEYIVSKLSD